MRPYRGTLCLSLAALLISPVATAWAKEPVKEPGPPVQIAILLDTSNSMDGLIDQAKRQLWNVVNEFIKAKQNGRTPRLEVALFEYGKSSLSPQSGYVRLILPLTDDLDRVSEELFALRTLGGEEYCGKVIQDAVHRLQWSRSPNIYKGIFIAGNEPFTQGPVDFHEACRAAIGQGIVVNTIFCGAHAEGERTGWKEGALLADGSFLHIDQSLKVAEIPAPQDDQIARLGVELNKTYIPYGRMGQAGLERQAIQDANASHLSQTAAAARSVSKGSSVYCTDAWDLVDALKNGKCKLEDVKDGDLPAELRGLSPAQRQARVTESQQKREALQQQIQELSKSRDKYLIEARRKQAGAPNETLDSAMIKAIRSQAGRQHYTFE